MSGHSHWSGIKHKKEIVDAKKGKVFSRLSKLITEAARGNPKPETNLSLRAVIEKAQENNMPKANIEKAIQRAVSAGSGIFLEEMIYEAVGPFGTGFLIKTISDNKNRTLAEIKQILKKYEASLGSVRWMFEGSKAKFPLELQAEQNQKIASLIKELETAEAVESVFTNLK